jgi:hypothetical protein
MDSGGTTIANATVNGSRTSQGFAAQWDNTDLYCGVRAVNAPAGAAWSVQRFRIQPGVVTPPPPVPPSSCPVDPKRVTLFINTNFGGRCLSFAPGEYPDLRQYGLDINVGSVRIPKGAFHVTLYDQLGLAGTPSHWDADMPQLTGYWSDRARSLRVERHTAPYDCTIGTDGATLFSESAYRGHCQTIVPSACVNLANFNLERNVSSIKNPDNGFAVRLYDGLNCSGQVGVFDKDEPDLAPHGWQDRARSVRVEKHRPTACNPGPDGLILYRDTGFRPGGGCLFITQGQDISDLTPLGYDRSITSIKFVGSYIQRYRVRIYRQPNYQDECGWCWQDQGDLRSCAGISMSVRIELYTPPTPIPTQPGDTLAGNIAPVASRDRAGSEAAVDGNLTTQWVGQNKQMLGLSWSRLAMIRRIVVWDRTQNSPDNSQVNQLDIHFSDGTIIRNLDMISGGPRCVDVSFPKKAVTWINLVPSDASGNNGYGEVAVWATSGPQSSSNACSNPRSGTPTAGTVIPPVLLAGVPGTQSLRPTSLAGTASGQGTPTLPPTRTPIPSRPARR